MVIIDFTNICSPTRPIYKREPICQNLAYSKFRIPLFYPYKNSELRYNTIKNINNNNNNNNNNINNNNINNNNINNNNNIIISRENIGNYYRNDLNGKEQCSLQLLASIAYDTLSMEKQNEISRSNKITNVFETSKPLLKSNFQSKYVNKSFYINPININNKTIVIFDLDDTLIPTDWIRNTYTSIKQNSSLSYLLNNEKNNDIYEYIRRKLDESSGGDLVSTICSIVESSKMKFTDIAIVTNARSTSWLKVLGIIFPELIELLNSLDIPIIRTEPIGIEPCIEDSQEYFDYWMMAKKKEFERVVMKCRNKYINYKNLSFDIISIGDNNFEEFAAINLCLTDKLVNLSKIIRCTPGLSPSEFVTQLNVIKNTIDTEYKKNHSHSWVTYSNTVSAKIVDSFCDDSTEDE